MVAVAGDAMTMPLARRSKMILHTLAFVVGGAVLGFAYYKIVGCRTGACPITSNPIVSTLYGALIGYLIGAGGRL